MPNGTTCHENGPNPSPLDPPNTPCCDGVCNHANGFPGVCGCSAAKQGCSDFSLAGLYGTDCCPGLRCIQTNAQDYCDTCLADGAKCFTADGNCCGSVCNSVTDVCGTSPLGSTCIRDADCATGTRCGYDLDPPGTCCYADATACTDDSQCCNHVCDVATGKCGCGADGSGCTRSGDCCTGTTLPTPFCNSLKQCGCVAAGGTCGAAADCCPGSRCNTATSKCACSALGGPCKVALDCCTGTCGAALTCCLATGNHCTAGTDCCSGMCKGDGTCK